MLKDTTQHKAEMNTNPMIHDEGVTRLLQSWIGKVVSVRFIPEYYRRDMKIEKVDGWYVTFAGEKNSVQVESVGFHKGIRYIEIEG